MTASDAENIDKYFTGEMTDEERIAFEKRLAQNPELKKELILHQELSEMITDGAADQLREDIKKIMADNTDQNSENSTLEDDPNPIPLLAAKPLFDSKDPGIFPGKTGRSKEEKNTFIRKIWYAAASIILVATVAGILYFSSTPDLTNEEIFTEYFEPYQNLVTYRNSSSADSLLNIGMAKYDKGEFGEALSYLSQVEGENLVLASFYGGISALAIDNTVSSQQSLEIVIKSQNNLLINAAKWYLSLALLKENKLDSVQNLLKELIDSNDSYYNKKAKVMLELVEERQLSVSRSDVKVEVLELQESLEESSPN